MNGDLEYIDLVVANRLRAVAGERACLSDPWYRATVEIVRQALLVARGLLRESGMLSLDADRFVTRMAEEMIAAQPVPLYGSCPRCRHVGWAHPGPDAPAGEVCVGSECRCQARHAAGWQPQPAPAGGEQTP